MSMIPNGVAAITTAGHPLTGSAALSHGAADDAGGAKKTLVDLVIAIGTDAPMLAVAQALDSVLDASIDAAGKSCPSSLRVTCLGIGSYFGTTRFNSSVSDFLAVYVEDPSDLQETPLPPGDLDRAVIDLSRYFDWHPNAHRAIFLVGDVSLETVSDEVAKTSDAIAAAQAANVQVYTCVNLQPDVNAAAGKALTLQGKDIAQYMRLAKETLGTGYISTNGAQDFPWMLRDVICDIASFGSPEDNGQGGGDDVGGCGDGHDACCSCCQCEQARLIVHAANMLSTVLRRVTDNCHPPGKGKSSEWRR